MARTYNIRYRLTWRDSENRWRKIYRGKTFTYAAPEGKCASYHRCWRQFQRDAAEYDLKLDRGNPTIDAHNRLLEHVHGIQDWVVTTYGDCKQSREMWSWLDRNHAEPLRQSISRREEFIGDDGTYELTDAIEICDRKAVDQKRIDDEAWQCVNLNWTIPSGFAGYKPTKPSGAAPWESIDEQPEDDPSTTIADWVDQFIDEKLNDAKRGELSPARVDKLRRNIDRFLDAVGHDVDLDAITGPILDAYRDSIRKEVVDGQIKSPTGNDRLQVVKTFFNWLYRKEAIESRPRVLKSDYAVSIAAPKIEIWATDEVQAVLRCKDIDQRVHLYVLLMLNCGFTNRDIADLRHDEVDWTAATITRKRSKTKKHDNVPTVTYRLWPETLDLLLKYRSQNAELAITDINGNPLIKGRLQASGKITNRSDAIRTLWVRAAKKVGVSKPLKLLRKTGASMLGEHDTHARFCEMYLAHSPKSIADRHYVTPSQKQFDAAIAWLRTALVEPEKVEVVL
ncbi:MAG: hypothetical protein VXZ84_09650 [Planctomycetota bacterium]|nr:hypothetical protein [Planctomycetota bacterium]